MVYYFFEHGEEFNRILTIPLNYFTILIGLIFFGNLIRSAQLKKFISIMKSHIGFIQSVWLTVGCTLLNYLPMNIGMILKARGLKRLSGIRYTHFASLSSVDILLTMISGACIGLIVLIISWSMFGPERIYTMLFFVVVLIIALLLFIIPANWLSNNEIRIIKIIHVYLKGVEQIKKKKSDLLILSLFIISRLLLIGIQFLICFSALGEQISFIACVLFSVITSLLLIVNITPGALGVREIMVGAISAVMGHGFEIGVLASGLYRACAMIIHLFIGIPGLIMLRINKIV